MGTYDPPGFAPANQPIAVAGMSRSQLVGGLMAQHQVRRLPVVEEDGRLVGVVAQADIARHGDAAATGQVVEEISESGGSTS